MNKLRILPGALLALHLICGCTRTVYVDRPVEVIKEVRPEPQPDPYEKYLVFVGSDRKLFHKKTCKFLTPNGMPVDVLDSLEAYKPCPICFVGVGSSGELKDVPAQSGATQPTPAEVRKEQSSSPTPSGTTPTGIPAYVGPRGGVYHYSKSGNKVYQKKR